MSEELRKIIEHILTGYPSIDEGMGEVKQWAKDCVPEEEDTGTNLDLTTTASADWQFHYERVGFNQCRTEILKAIEEG